MPLKYLASVFVSILILYAPSSYAIDLRESLGKMLGNYAKGQVAKNSANICVGFLQNNYQLPINYIRGSEVVLQNPGQIGYTVLMLGYYPATNVLTPMACATNGYVVHQIWLNNKQYHPFNGF